MKLAPRDAHAFFAKPDLTKAGLLIYGPDAMRISLIRKDLAQTITGPEGEAEMRLTRLSGAEVRKDPAQIADASRASGFFPGQRIVVIENAGDGLAKPLTETLEGWQPGDAFLLVTAGQLTPRSPLRKLFETAPNALAAAIYADPPGRDDVEAALARAGIQNTSPDAMRDLLALAQVIDPGDLRQTLEKLSLYKSGDPSPVTPDDVAAIAPAITDAGLDEVIASVADGAVADLAEALPRLAGQGTQPTGVCIALNRYFRQLHAAAAHPQGPDQALARARPPVFGPRRDRMARQARDWGSARLESILGLIVDADLTLRSASAAPQRAIVERLMIRIAMTRPR